MDEPSAGLAVHFPRSGSATWHAAAARLPGMPGKPRRPAPAKVRAAVVAQWNAHVAYAGALSAEQLAAPSELEGWDVATLVGHVAMTIRTVAVRADRPVDGITADVVAWTIGAPTAASAVD